MDHRDLPSGHHALRHARTSTAGGVYLVTTVTLQRQPFFCDQALADVVCACFADPGNSVGAEMLAWVVMPDHVHLLLRLGEELRLDAVMSRVKANSARAVNRSRGAAGPLWSRAYHDRQVHGDTDIERAIAYILLNPVRAGLVAEHHDYPFTHVSWRVTSQHTSAHPP